MTNDAKNVIFTAEGNPDSFREVPTACSQAEPEELAEDEEIFAISRHLIAENHPAYEELAK